MPYRKEKFENEDIAHIIFKGVDGNELFKDMNDYFRMIFSTYEFNDLNPATIRRRRELRIAIKNKINRGRASVVFPDRRDRFVDLFSFAFMPNHIHLLMRQTKENGIVRFTSKIGTGFGGYATRKHGRQGHVFQSAYTAVPIKTDEQLMIVIAYIHTNPLSLKYPRWKETGIENIDEALEFIEEFKWSSHADYLGILNFPSVTQRDFILDLFGGVDKYREFISNYIKSKGIVKTTEDGPLQI